MSLMFPWATPEYMLWKMSIGQLIYYHNEAIAQKYPPAKKAGQQIQSLADKPHSELVKIREELRKQYGEV
jgi:hypothetical protein